MNTHNRRAFLQSAEALACSVSPVGLAARHVGLTLNHRGAHAGTVQIAQPVAANEGKKPLRLGLIIDITNDPDSAVAKVHDLGLPTCQAFVDELEPGMAKRLRQAPDKYGIEATSLVDGGPEGFRVRETI